jgi:hypothetical protein
MTTKREQFKTKLQDLTMDEQNNIMLRITNVDIEELEFLWDAGDDERAKEVFSDIMSRPAITPRSSDS